MPDKNTPSTHPSQKELELPETIFSSDIEDKVYQGIVLSTLMHIEGIHLLEGSFFQSLMGRVDKIKGIHVDQDSIGHSVRIRIEVNISFGISIPQKAEEIQSKVSHEVTKMTGVHVSEVHVVFRELASQESSKEKHSASATLKELERSMQQEFEEEEF